jgi:glucose/arabinose dehydrogenase
VRNAEGLDILPGTNTLWAAVNNRDEIRVPVDQDVDGDGSSDLGKIVPSYVDKNPPDPLLQVRDGGNYGWPFCNIVPNATMSQLSSLPDYDTNPGGSNFNCATVTPSTRAFPAHAAPLGMSFLHDTAVPQSIRRGLAVAQHGCWNCTALNVGFKVVFVPFDNVGNAGPEVDLITGFVTDPVARQVWGRPVDVIADAGGNLLVSDDMAGVIYQLYPK